MNIYCNAGFLDDKNAKYIYFKQNLTTINKYYGLDLVGIVLFIRKLAGVEEKIKCENDQISFWEEFVSKLLYEIKISFKN